METQTEVCSYCERGGHRYEACEAQRIIKCVTEWVQVALREGYKHAREGGGPEQGAWSNLPVEMAHSALLQRLVSGKEPLELAPPRAYAYPWYTLYETGEGNAFEVNVPDGPLGPHERPIVIDQGVWNLLETREDGSWIIQWATGHPRFEVKLNLAPAHPFARYVLTRLS